MSLLAANLDALARFHPEAARVVAGAGAVERGQWRMARAGVPSVKRDGLWLCSAFDPVAEAAKAVPHWDDADFAFLPGLGAGYLAEAAAARYDDLPVVVAEADPAWFREVLVHRDLTALWGRAVPLVGPDPAVVGAFFGGLSCPNVATLRWRPLVQQEGAWHDAVADELARAQTRSGVNAATFRRFGKLWRRNLAHNEAYAAAVRPLAALRHRWRGCPAVIAAAGPSLADSLAWIAAHRTRLVLVAVDTAWAALARAGLEPDVLVVLDGQYWNARHLDPPLPPRTLVVTEWTGPPRAFRIAPGRVYVAATSVSLLRRREADRWGPLGALPTGGSVATAAYSLALHLGCAEIAFAGLDLGYPGGTHARGSQFEQAALDLGRRLVPAETSGLRLRGENLIPRPAVDGGTVLSDARMDLFRGWLADAAAARPDVRTVNLSRRGSFIPGLAPPPVSYGDAWPLLPPRNFDVPPLTRRTEESAAPPWDELERCLEARDSAFAAEIEGLWSAARSYWGTAWDSWAGREKTAWDRFPSPRTRRRLVELVELTLQWRGFWETA